MKIYLIRHGETNENANSLLMGRTHGVLSATGKIQAELTGLHLKDERISIIYSSSLHRCLDTSNLINNTLLLPIKTDELLIERDFGSYTNSHTQHFNFDDLDRDTPENKAAGVETMASVRNRIQLFLEQIFELHKNDNIIVVTHNNPIRFFLGEFLNKPYNEILKEHKVNNCSITIFETNDGKSYTQILLDDTSHLKTN